MGSGFKLLSVPMHLGLFDKAFVPLKSYSIVI